MTISYTWEITGLKVLDETPHTKAVVQTYWKKIGTDENGNTAFFEGATPFSAATILPEDFIPFDQLTEEIVLSWIQAEVTGDYEEHVNSQIEKAINKTLNPVTEADLPWS